MGKKIVVAQLLPALNKGGVERGTIEVANDLANNGFNSVVISSGGDLTSLLLPDVKHIRIDIGRKSLLTLFKIRTLKKIFIDLSVDIVHARSRLPAWLAYRAIAGIQENKPKFVTTVHGLYSVKRYSSIMARGDRVIAVSETTSNYITTNYSDYLKQEPELIYRGINPEEFPYGYEPDFRWLHGFYEKHHQLVGKKIVLLPGRLTRLKGVKDLLPWLKSCNESIKLVLTATPNDDLYTAKLYHWFKEKGVDNHVYWIGMQKSMAEIYSIANVVVSASVRPEAFGRTVLEALSIGTPVAAYSHGGVDEILTLMFPEGKVEKSNQQQLSDTINSLISNPVEVPERCPFLLESMLLKLRQLYMEMLNE